MSKVITVLLLCMVLVSCEKEECKTCEVIIESNAAGIDLAAQGFSGFEDRYDEISISSSTECNGTPSTKSEAITSPNNNPATRRTRYNCE